MIYPRLSQATFTSIFWFSHSYQQHRKNMGLPKMMLVVSCLLISGDQMSRGQTIPTPLSSSLEALRQHGLTMTQLSAILPPVEGFLGETALYPFISQTLAQIGALNPVVPTDLATLQKYNVSPNITISGISGGGSFSMMLSFIHSSFIKGTGIFAGAPYMTGVVAFSEPWNIFNANAYYPFIDSYVKQGLIDNTTNIASNWGEYQHKGTNDPIPFNPAQNAAEFQHYGVNPGVIKSVTNTRSGHCVPTDNGINYPFSCEIGGNNAVCNCGYESIFDMFNTTYAGSFSYPSSSAAKPKGQLIKFGVTEFLPTGVTIEQAGLWNYAYAYVPPACQNSTTNCRLHFAFHGCGQSEISMYRGTTPDFLLDTGYFQAADANNVIVIGPAAKINLAIGSIGCFDIYGYTSLGSNSWNTRRGVQPYVIKRMYERVVFGL